MQEETDLRAIIMGRIIQNTYIRQRDTIELAGTCVTPPARKPCVQMRTHLRPNRACVHQFRGVQFNCRLF